MLQQHPYLNAQENITGKYNKPVNLSQQLSFSKPQPNQPQPEQNYATPQWQKPTNQIYIGQLSQPQIQQIQSKYVPQPQLSNAYPIQQSPVLIAPQQVQQMQYQQQQYIPPMAQQLPQRQSSPPRIYKMNQQPEQPPPIPVYEEYPLYYAPPYYERDPVVYQEEPLYYPSPIYDSNLYLPVADEYFKPNQKSFITNLDDRGNRYQEFPFRKETILDYFVKALIDMATQEEKIEKAKINLFTQSDFRVSNLFSSFNHGNGDQLFMEDLIGGLRSFSLQPESCDIKLLFEEYGDQGTMMIQQFGDMIKPQKELKNTRAYDDDDSKILPETKIKVRKLFVVLLNAESVFEGHRQELVTKQLELGENLDYKQLHGDIFYNDHVEDMKKYLQSQGQYFDLDTINGLFKRFDRNCSGKITVNEFIYGFQGRLTEDDYQL